MSLTGKRLKGKGIWVYTVGMIRINHEFGQEGSDKEISTFEDIGKLFVDECKNLPENRDDLIRLSHEITVFFEKLKKENILKTDILELFYSIVAVGGEGLNEEQNYFINETLDQLENILDRT